MNDNNLMFSQLLPQEQAALSRFYKEGVEINFREGRNAAWELAKVLLTVNSGAAAGLFIVIRSATANSLLIVSFYTFCFGVCFVVAAYFIGAVQFNSAAVKFEEDVQLVYQNKLSPLDFITRQRKRMRGKWSEACPVLGAISFVCILAGGIMAGMFLIKSPQQISDHANLPSHKDSVPTNSIAKLNVANTDF